MITQFIKLLLILAHTNELGLILDQLQFNATIHYSGICEKSDVADLIRSLCTTRKRAKSLSTEWALALYKALPIISDKVCFYLLEEKKKCTF
jgi:hypothetical protein